MVRHVLIPLLALSFLLPQLHAQKALVRITFSRRKISGWKNFNKKFLSPAKTTTTTTTRRSLPPQFRTSISAEDNLMYSITLKPGKYTVTLGFAELSKASCKKNKRIFNAKANNRRKKNIDVFEASACRTPYTLSLKNVVVTKKTNRLDIILTSVKGPPIINNFEVFGEPSKPKKTMSPSAKPIPETLVSDIDVAGLTDQPDLVTGTSSIFPNLVPIKGTNVDARFSRHRFGKDFSYEIPVQPKVTYSVVLSFAETVLGNCLPKARIFEVQVYDAAGSVKDGVTLSKVDVFSAAGCMQAYSQTVRNAFVGRRGVLRVRFISKNKENAFISGLQILTSDRNYLPTPTPSPSLGPRINSVEENVGIFQDIPVSGTRRFSTLEPIEASKAASENVLRFSRFGPDFQYLFNLKPGKYIVTLSFSENFPGNCNTRGSRVFNVMIGGKLVLEKFDIFKQVGCYKGIDTKFRVSVASEPLPIRFSSIKNFAQINYIKIVKA